MPMTTFRMPTTGTSTERLFSFAGTSGRNPGAGIHLQPADAHRRPAVQRTDNGAGAPRPGVVDGSETRLARPQAR